MLDFEDRYKLTFYLLQGWRYTYFTKWLRWAYHEIEYRRRAKHIPAPFEGE